MRIEEPKRELAPRWEQLERIQATSVPNRNKGNQRSLIRWLTEDEDLQRRLVAWDARIQRAN